MPEAWMNAFFQYHRTKKRMFMKFIRLNPILLMMSLTLFIALSGCPSKDTQQSGETTEKAAKGADPNCATCGGDGTIVVKVKQECTTCDGTGKVLGNNCQTCHGTGEMEVAEEQNCPKCNSGKK
jgi:DnaJ-class molecular chaperone